MVKIKIENKNKIKLRRGKKKMATDFANVNKI